MTGNAEETLKTIVSDKAVDRYIVIEHEHDIPLIDMENAFARVFSNLPDNVLDPHAMKLRHILRSINTQWNGETSSDKNAIPSTIISTILLGEWDGSSSDDPRAMSSEVISQIIANTTE